MIGCGSSEIDADKTTDGIDKDDIDTEEVNDKEKKDDETKVDDDVHEDDHQKSDDEADDKDNLESTGSTEDDDEFVESSEDNADLTLQVTKIDEEAGATIDNNENYQMLNEVILDNPKLGTPNDFSMYTIDFDKEIYRQTMQIYFFGINRLDTPIKNIRFKITLGTTDGEYVWEDMPVTISDDIFGTFKPDHTMPIMLDVTEEELDVFEKITKENQVFEIDDFNFDMDE